jgi:hypothetical protein
MSEEKTWDWWYAALERPHDIGKASDLLISPGDFELGYYRRRHNKGGQWEPVAIYPDEQGHIVGLWGDHVSEDIAELFQYCCRYPVTYEAYQAAVDGAGWEDEPARAEIGDNLDGVDELEKLRIEYEGEKEQLVEALKRGVHSQADADRVSIWKDRLMKIKGKAEVLFKAEKAPVLEEAKRVDEKYRYLAHKTESDAVRMIEAARAGLADFLKAQQAAERARQDAARAEAARIQKEADEAAAAAAAALEDSTGKDPSAVDAYLAEMNAKAEALAAARAEAEREAEARKVSAGRTGARSSTGSEVNGRRTGTVR